ncbi:hypothetical protein DFH07DRAFT_968208 [Mycena maculata]|uniref:DUF6534 domain-containing protein n=1 Tax=Mycena maculata TaxID=230809 RepID=A0AAD7I2F1_9AGAR|nr:hypothetical protein DFH07DRAFT_968208 [Mycena maculata]
MSIPSPPLTLPAEFSLTTTVGVLEIGVLLAVFLSGVLTVQVYMYFNRFPNDPWGFKAVVALVFLLDFGHTLTICNLIYTITVTQYGEPQLLLTPPMCLDAAILLSGLIGPLEQGWFTYRLYKLTKTLTLPLLCALLSLLRFGGSVGLFVASLQSRTISDYDMHVMWLVEAVIVVGAAVDVILVVAQCYYLSFWRGGGYQLGKLVKQLMTWTIETGALTTAGALALLLTFLTMDYNFIYLAFFVMMAKLFANSLLFSLNARERFARICAEVLPTTSMQSMSQVASQRTIPQAVSPTLPFPAHAPKLHVQDSLTPLRICTDMDDGVTTPSSPRRMSRVSFAGSPTSAYAQTSFLS